MREGLAWKQERWQEGAHLLPDGDGSCRALCHSANQENNKLFNSGGKGAVAGSVRVPCVSGGQGGSPSRASVAAGQGASLPDGGDTPPSREHRLGTEGVA